MRFAVAAFCTLLTSLPAVSAIVAQERSDQRQMVRIGILLDGPWEEEREVVRLFQSEIDDLLRTEFEMRFPAEARRRADWTTRGVEEMVSRSLADPEVDLLIALGPIASHVIARRGDLPKPAIAASIIDAELQGLPFDNGTSGVPNLSYVAIPSAVSRDLTVLRELTPFHRVAFLINGALLDAIPGLSSAATQAARSLGVEFEIVAAAPPVSDILAAISQDVDAVYMTPLANLTETQWDDLVAGLISRDLPTFSYLGVSEVRRGLLASLNTDAFFSRLARRVALNVQRILLGEPASTIPVAFARGEQLTVNMATARAIGVHPSWTVLTDAVLLKADSVAGARRITLASVAREAVARNLDLLAEDRVVDAGARNVGIARSQLLPQLEVSAQSTVIDRDRAEASLGSQPQRSLTSGGTLTQLIFSEPALANLRIQGGLQEARVHGRRVLELDITLAAVNTYLNVLRAQTIFQVRQDNLRVTRSNLELARVRRSIGSSGPGEVFRWESELAADRQAVIAAQQDIRIAETALNQILNRPLNEPIMLEDVALEDPPFLTSDPRLAAAVDNPRNFELFRDFMIEEGVSRSPELRALDAAIAAQRRFLSSVKNSFWAPTVALQGNLSSQLAEGGAGSGDFQIPNLPSGSFPQSDDLSWGLALRLSLPIFEGGRRFEERSQATQELAQLNLERDAVEERVRQRIITELHRSGSSYPSIALLADAAEAAERNLDLVTDAYSRGVATVIDLLDAQNAALVADLRAANAVYDFLLDMMAVERAVGRFDFFVTPEEQESFFQRMEEHFAESGISLVGVTN